MDIEEILYQVRIGAAFVTVASAKEKQTLMALCARHWKRVNGCSPHSWERFSHLISHEPQGYPTFSGRSVKELEAEGMVQYLFKDVVKKPIVIDLSALL